MRQFVHDLTLLQIGYLVRQHETFHSALLIKVDRSHWRCPFARPTHLSKCTAAGLFRTKIHSTARSC
jgi:hypothetical protein